MLMAGLTFTLQDVCMTKFSGSSPYATPSSGVGSGSDSYARGPGSIPGPATYFCFSFH